MLYELRRVMEQGGKGGRSGKDVYKSSVERVNSVN